MSRLSTVNLSSYSQGLASSNGNKSISEVFGKGVYIWVPDNEACFVPAKVTNTFKQGEDGQIALVDDEGNDKITVMIPGKVTNSVFRMDAQSLEGVDDMVYMKELNDASLLHNLRLRFRRDEVYTSIGSILVSVNPFKLLPLYTPQMLDYYIQSKSEQGKSSPHIYKIADDAFNSLLSNATSQSCIVSGESGAGKTEATKIFLHYIAEVSAAKSKSVNTSSGNLLVNPAQPFLGSSDSSKSSNTKNKVLMLQELVLQANPLMEAFGNAKTSRNDNSSRFGKWIRIQVHSQTGEIVGASITSYLLEKSRIVYLAAGERNYHIFYQLCAGARARPKEIGETYGILDPNSYRYLNQSGVSTIKGVNDEAEFLALEASLSQFGISESEKDSIFRILSGILLLGNLEFVAASESNDSSKVSNIKILEKCANLLGINDPLLLERSLCVKDLTTYAGIVFQAQNVDRARDTRDVLAKTIYGRMFDWLLNKINQSLEKSSISQQQTPIDIIPEKKTSILKSAQDFLANLANTAQTSGIASGITTALSAVVQGTDTTTAPLTPPTPITNNPRSKRASMLPESARRHSKINGLYGGGELPGLRAINENLSTESPMIASPPPRKPSAKKSIGISRQQRAASKLHSTSIDSDHVKIIGVLDIFGFESFERNSFEQLCINYCNEKLQFQFNEHMFRLEQELYKAENLIEVSNFSFVDNRSCLDFLEAKVIGVFAMIDEESKLPKGSDDSLLRKLYQSNPKQKHLEKPPARIATTHFVIVHYAGGVAYDSFGLIEKNRDVTPKDIETLCSKSSLTLLQNLANVDKKDPAFVPKSIADYQARQNTSSTKASLGAKFLSQLATLIAEIDTTELRYIRCIKPNNDRRGGVFSSNMVMAQLRYAGILEVCRIRKTGYPIRRDFDEFLQRYQSLLPPTTRPTSGTKGSFITTAFAHFQKEYNVLSDDWRVGKTMVFMRGDALNALEFARATTVAPFALRMQKVIRVFLAKSKLKRAKEVLLLIRESLNNALPENFEGFVSQSCKTAEDEDMLFDEVRKNLTDSMMIAQEKLPYAGRKIPLVKEAWRAVRRFEEEALALKMIADAMKTNNNSGDGNIKIISLGSNSDSTTNNNIPAIENAVKTAKALGLSKRRRVKEAEVYLEGIKKAAEAVKVVREAVDQGNKAKIDAAIEKAENTFGKGVISAAADKEIVIRKKTGHNGDLSGLPAELIQAKILQSRLSEEKIAMEGLESALKIKDAQSIAKYVEQMKNLGLGSHPLIAQAQAQQSTATEEAKIKAEASRKLEIEKVMIPFREAVSRRDLDSLIKAKLAVVELGLDRPVDTTVTNISNENDIRTEVAEAFKLESNLRDLRESINQLKMATNTLQFQLLKQVNLSDNDIAILKSALDHTFGTILFEFRDEDESESILFFSSERIAFEDASAVYRQAVQRLEAQKLIATVSSNESSTVDEIKGALEQARGASIVDNPDIEKIEARLKIMLRDIKKNEKKPGVLRRQSAKTKIQQPRKPKGVSFSNISTSARRAAMQASRRQSGSMRDEADIKVTAREMNKKATETDRYRLANFFALRQDDFFGNNAIMLQYRSQPLTRSLLNLQDELSEIAIQIHRSILGYCGDLIMQFPATLAYSILETGTDNPDLVDEIFMQLCAHLIMNPRATSVHRGWQLMCIFLSAFRPSSDFELFLLRFLLGQQRRVRQKIGLEGTGPSSSQNSLSESSKNESGSKSGRKTIIINSDQVPRSPSSTVSKGKSFYSISGKSKTNFSAGKKDFDMLLNVLPDMKNEEDFVDHDEHELVEVYSSYAIRKLHEVVVKGTSQAVFNMDILQQYQDRPPVLAEVCYPDDTTSFCEVLVPPNMKSGELAGICSAMARFADDERSSLFGLFLKFKILSQENTNEPTVTNPSASGIKGRSTISNSIASESSSPSILRKTLFGGSEHHRAQSEKRYSASPVTQRKLIVSKRIEDIVQRFTSHEMVSIPDSDFFGDHVLRACRQKRIARPVFRQRIIIPKEVEDYVIRSDGYDRVTYQQFRSDFLSGILPIPSESLVSNMVACFIIIDNEGELLPKNAEELITPPPNSNYKKLSLYLPTSWVPLKSIQQWSKLVFTDIQVMKSYTPTEARNDFVLKCRDLPMFGVHYYPVELKGSSIGPSSMLLGINSKSMMLCKDVNTVKTIIKFQFIDNISLESGGREFKVVYKIAPTTPSESNTSGDREEISMYSTFSPQICVHLGEYLSIFGMETFSDVIEQIRSFEPLTERIFGPSSKQNPLPMRANALSTTKSIEVIPKVGARESAYTLHTLDQSSILRERMKLAGASDEDIESVLRSDAEML